MPNPPLFHLKLKYLIDGKPQFIDSPPFRVKVTKPETKKSTDQKKPSTVEISRTQKRDLWWRLTEDHLKIPVGLPLEVVRAFLGKSDGADAGGNVSVSVSTQTDAKAATDKAPAE